MTKHSNALKKAVKEAMEFPLFRAIMGRRSRRFGLGMEIPSGPLKFTSRSAPVPLSELEQTLLITAGTGVSGWNFGVPFGPHQPQEHGHMPDPNFWMANAPGSYLETHANHMHAWHENG